MQVVEDTTALHRCGEAALMRLREDGARLERLVASGDHLPFLRDRKAVYRRMDLTMGGVADLLGLALGWLAYRETCLLPARFIAGSIDSLDRGQERCSAANAALSTSPQP
jgi:hypothetical protein